MDLDQRQWEGTFQGAHEAVAAYIRSLRRPDVEDEQVIKLKEELANAADPMDRLIIDSRLRALEPRATKRELERGFIEYAKEWADAKGVVRESFEAEGVPARVLNKAGLQKVRRPHVRSMPSPSRIRARDVLDELIKQGEPFTVQKVQEQADVSPALARSVVLGEALERDGTIIEVRPEGWAATGRQPRTFRANDVGVAPESEEWVPEP